MPKSRFRTNKTPKRVLALPDQCLIPDTSTTSFLPELLEHPGVHTDRDQLARCVTKRRTAYAPHPAQLRL